MGIADVCDIAKHTIEFTFVFEGHFRALSPAGILVRCVPFTAVFRIAHYRYDIASIVKQIQKDYGEESVVTYYGDTSSEDRQKAIEAIQNPEGPTRFLVGTPQTGGYGITLTGASTMIYYSNGYDLEKRQQSEARIDRIGQEKPMTYIDIIAEDTIDEKIVDALRRKVNIATEIMGEELKDWI